MACQPGELITQADEDVENVGKGGLLSFRGMLRRVCRADFDKCPEATSGDLDS